MVFQKSTILFLIFLFPIQLLWAQDYRLVKGKVVDHHTGEGVSFANISVEGEFGYGAESDLEGDFKFQIPKEWKQVKLVVSFIGYKKKKVKWKSPFPFLNVKLKEEVSELGEVVFEAGENPAYPIIRKTASNKKKITEKAHQQYSNQSLNKVEVSLTNINGIEDFKIVREAKKYVLELQKSNPKADTSLIPLFASESLIKNYRKGGSYKEKILQSRVMGVGLDETDEIVNLIMNGSLHSGDLNENNIILLDKAIPSPLSDYWKINYKLWLVDSLDFEGRPTYKIEVEPRIKGSLAFEGTLWIDKEDKALAEADLQLASAATINFIKQFDLKQKMERQPNGEWLKTTYSVRYDMSDFFDGYPGILLKYDYHTKDYQLDIDVPSSVFEKKFEVFIENKESNDATFWEEVNTEYLPEDSISTSQMKTLEVIDSINNLQSVKSMSKWLRFIVNGYTEGDYVNWGKYPNTFAYNNVEGVRLGVGFRLNFSPARKWLVIPNVAYGFKDNKWKYDIKLFYNLNPEKGAFIGAEVVNELMPLSLLELETGVNPWVRTLARWGGLKRKNPYYRELQRLTWSSFVKSDMRLNLNLSHDKLKIWNFDQLAIEPESGEAKGYLGINVPLETYEANLGFVYTKHKKAIFTQNNELKFIPPLNDVVFETNLYGGFFNDLNAKNWTPYAKWTFKARQMFVPLLGIGAYSYWINGGYVFTKAPYQLLRVHQGTELPFAFNGVIRGMNEFEFVSDYYVEVRLEHYFEGRLSAAVPGLRQLNRWFGIRFLVLGDVVWGGLSDKNKAFNKGLIGSTSLGEDGLQRFNVLDPNKPFVDAGFGVENIFRFFRLEFTKRLNYNNTDYRAREWRLKASATFKF